LDSKGIDIILGMDWLRKYDEVILCAKRAIRLTKEDGTIVEFSAAVPAEQVSMLNKVQGTSLNEIEQLENTLMYSLKSYQVCHQIATLSL
jgi:hypothetical protein